MQSVSRLSRKREGPCQEENVEGLLCAVVQSPGVEIIALGPVHPGCGGFYPFYDADGGYVKGSDTGGNGANETGADGRSGRKRFVWLVNKYDSSAVRNTGRNFFTFS